YESLGASASRVRIVLAQPVAHRVRSDRNTVIVDFEKPSGKAAPYVLPPGNQQSTLNTQQSKAVPDAMLALQQPSSPPRAATAALTDPQEFASRGRQYNGHPVSLDFQGADLRAVLRTFAEISGLNIVIDPAVTGTVDVALRDVPWDQALDIILRANKLGYSIDGTIVRISPISVLATEEKERSDLAKAQIET